MEFSGTSLMLILLTGVVGLTGTEAVIQVVQPHPTNCAQFYNFTAPAQSPYWEDHLQECPYNEVFDTDSGACKHYTKVSCRDRTIPVGPCDYRANQCERSHCSPCNVRYPVCKGLSDGIHPNPAKPGSPFFMYCSGGRTVAEGNCMNIFNPYTHK